MRINLLLISIFSIFLGSCASSNTPEQNDEIVKYFMYSRNAEKFGNHTEEASLTLISGGSFVWDKEIATTDKYDVYIGGNAESSITDLKLTFSCDGKDYVFDMPSSKGPFAERNLPRKSNMERTKVLTGVPIEAGMHKIAVSAPEVDTDELLLSLHLLELVPHSSLDAIAKSEQRALAARSDFKWMNDAKYGLMFHWTNHSVGTDGVRRPFEQAVNEFDVDKFVELVEKTGAGYVIFTVGHAEQFCPAPIKSWEAIHPGQTTERDLVMEIADGLAKIDVKLMCYMHSQGTARFREDSNEEFFERFKTILVEFGNRYGEKLAGYWFDCWSGIYAGYPDASTEEFYHIAKTGNKDRLVSLNSWIFPVFSPWQDYWAGEVRTFIAPPKNGTYTDGPAPGLPTQILLTMEDDWSQGRKESMEPWFEADELAQYINDCADNGGAVTINLSIYQDVAISKEAEEIMSKVKQMVR